MAVPHHVDWYEPADTLEDLNARLSKVTADIDDNFESLVTDIASAALLPVAGVTKISKKTDQTLNNSTTFQDDSELKFIGAAFTTYIVEGWLLLAATVTTADWKFQWNLPSGATIYWGPEFIAAVANWDPVAVGSSPAALSTGSITAGADNNTHGFSFTAVIILAATGGTCTLQWAQNSAVVTDNKVKAGSTILIH